MATYTVKKSVPSCYVGKDLLNLLENYIKQKAADLEAGAPEVSYKRYEVKMSDRQGGDLDVHSVDELPLSPMPSDTTKLQLWGYSPSIYDIKIQFSTQGSEYPYSYYEISYTGHTAREMVGGMESEIGRLIGRFRYKGLIRPLGLNGSYAAILFGVVMFSTAPVFLAIHDWLHAGWMAIAATFYMAMVVMLQRMPYTIFDTLDNKERL